MFSRILFEPVVHVVLGHLKVYHRTGSVEKKYGPDGTRAGSGIACQRADDGEVRVALTLVHIAARYAQSRKCRIVSRS